MAGSINRISKPHGKPSEERKASFLESCHLSRSQAAKGLEHISDFLEVCAGNEVLTEAMKQAGLKVLEPHGIERGYDLTKHEEVRRLEAKIAKYRPFITHLAPCCRIFS